MEDIEQRLKAVETNTNQILSLMKSNPEFKTKGIIEQLNDVKWDVDVLKKKETIFHTRTATYAGVATTAVLVIVWIGDKIIKLLLNK